MQSNKDLDLPTQQELLAQFRCDEIAAGALEEFNVQAKSQRKPVEAGKVVEGLGAMMFEWKARALGEWPRRAQDRFLTANHRLRSARFDKDGSRYHQGVYSRKRADLLAQLDAALAALFLGQLKNLHKQALASFKRELGDGLKGEAYSFADVVAGARSACETRFVEGAEEARLKDTDWTYDDELELLREEMDAVAVQSRSDETKKMVNLIEVRFSARVRRRFALLMIGIVAQFPQADRGARRGRPVEGLGRHVGPGAQVVQGHASQGGAELPHESD